MWRIKVETQGRDGFSFLDFKHALSSGGETRYTIQWGATPLVGLGRLQLPEGAVFPPKASRLRMEQGQWYYVEISAYQGLMQVWVNGKKLIAYTDPQPLPPGTIGLSRCTSQRTKTPPITSTTSPCAS